MKRRKLFVDLPWSDPETGVRGLTRVFYRRVTSALVVRYGGAKALMAQGEFEIQAHQPGPLEHRHAAARQRHDDAMRDLWLWAREILAAHRRQITSGELARAALQDADRGAEGVVDADAQTGPELAGGAPDLDPEDFQDDLVLGTGSERPDAPVDAEAPTGDADGADETDIIAPLIAAATQAYAQWMAAGHALEGEQLDQYRFYGFEMLWRGPEGRDLAQLNVAGAWLEVFEKEAAARKALDEATSALARDAIGRTQTMIRQNMPSAPALERERAAFVCAGVIEDQNLLLIPLEEYSAETHGEPIGEPVPDPWDGDEAPRLVVVRDPEAPVPERVTLHPDKETDERTGVYRLGDLYDHAEIQVLAEAIWDHSSGGEEGRAALERFRQGSRPAGGSVRDGHRAGGHTA